MHFWVLWIWLALCALQDLRQRHIANTLTLGAALLAAGYLLWTGSTWLGAAAAQGGWALLLALLFTLPGYAMGRMGAGDVKLMAPWAWPPIPSTCWGRLLAPGSAACCGC